jgi:hypothetical protein
MIENGKITRPRMLVHLLSSRYRPVMAQAPPTNPRNQAKKKIKPATGCGPLSLANRIGPIIQNKTK